MQKTDSNSNFVPPETARQVWACFSGGGTEDPHFRGQVQRSFGLTDGQMNWILANPPESSLR